MIKGREDNDEGWTPEAGTSVVKDYRIWRYVTENTIPGNDDHQKNGISTGIVFKGKLLAGTNLETTMSSFIRLSGANILCLKV